MSLPHRSMRIGVHRRSSRSHSLRSTHALRRDRWFLETDDAARLRRRLRAAPAPRARRSSRHYGLAHARPSARPLSHCCHASMQEVDRQQPMSLPRLLIVERVLVQQAAIDTWDRGIGFPGPRRRRHQRPDRDQPSLARAPPDPGGLIQRLSTALLVSPPLIAPASQGMPESVAPQEE